MYCVLKFVRNFSNNSNYEYNTFLKFFKFFKFYYPIKKIFGIFIIISSNPQKNKSY